MKGVLEEGRWLISRIKWQHFCIGKRVTFIKVLAGKNDAPFQNILAEAYQDFKLGTPLKMEVFVGAYFGDVQEDKSFDCS